MCRLSIIAASTVAELAAINLAANFLSERARIAAAAIICDSRPALAAISREQDARLLRRGSAGSYTPCTKEAATSRCPAWVPSHIGIRGDEAVDCAAKDVHDLDVTNFLCSAEVGCAAEIVMSGGARRAASGLGHLLTEALRDDPRGCRHRQVDRRSNARGRSGKSALQKTCVRHPA
ncbi:hypothetical protein MRX96_034608 [Rhipicephalus microplus]